MNPFMIVLKRPVCCFLFMMAVPLLGWGQASQNGDNQGIHFKKITLHDAFISEGVAVADINKDGKKDIAAGPYWFEAPSWKSHTIFPAKNFDPAKEWSNSFQNFAMDVNEDGWTDIIRFGFPGREVHWFENPKGASQTWQEHLIDSSGCNESPMMVDLDGNGKQDLVFAHERTRQMMWFKAEKAGDSIRWIGQALSEKNAPGTNRFSHGLGFGDVNGDGRKDVIVRQGWWEAPEERQQLPWRFHSAPLGEPCSQMYAYDFDADGDSDIISASAHAYGIWLHEMIEQGDSTTFMTHLIDSSFSQTHAIVLKDLNQDGLPDLITGKRHFAHLGKDLGGMDTPVLYWYELQRDGNNKPIFTPHLIDNDSGVGVHLTVEDINDDGKLDIISSNKKGVFCFLQE